jgi:hypothetical protein
MRYAVIYTRVSPPQPPFDSGALDEVREMQMQSCESEAVNLEAIVVGWYDDDLPDSEYRKGLGRPDGASGGRP